MLPNIRSGTSADCGTIPEVHGLVKAALALTQLLFGVVTLIRNSKRQIGCYGYAAYGLTVTPYVLMSALNLVTSMIRPNFPALYLVHSNIMDEATKRGAVFDGVVDELSEEAAQIILEEGNVISGVFRIHQGMVPLLSPIKRSEDLIQVAEHTDGRIYAFDHSSGITYWYTTRFGTWSARSTIPKPGS